MTDTVMKQATIKTISDGLYTLLRRDPVSLLGLLRLQNFPYEILSGSKARYAVYKISVCVTMQGI